MTEKKRIPGPAGYSSWECRYCTKDTALRPCILQVEDNLFVPMFCAFAPKSVKWRQVR